MVSKCANSIIQISKFTSTSRFTVERGRTLRCKKVRRVTESNEPWTRGCCFEVMYLYVDSRFRNWNGYYYYRYILFFCYVNHFIFSFFICFFSVCFLYSPKQTWRSEIVTVQTIRGDFFFIEPIQQSVFDKTNFEWYMYDVLHQIARTFQVWESVESKTERNSKNRSYWE